MVAEDVSVPNLKSPDLTFRDAEGRLTTWFFVYTKEEVFEKYLSTLYKPMSI